MKTSAALLIAIAALAVLIIGAGEVWARPAAESAVAEAVARRYDLARAPTVSIRGFPFLIDAARGRLDSVHVSFTGYDAGGLRIDEARLELQSVSFELFPLLRGEGSATAEKAIATAGLTDTDLTAFLRTRRPELSVRFTAGVATVTVIAPALGAVDVGGRLELSDSTLRFTPHKVESIPIDLVTFSIPIPPVAGISVESLRLEAGRAVLTADVTKYVVARAKGP